MLERSRKEKRKRREKRGRLNMEAEWENYMIISEDVKGQQLSGQNFTSNCLKCGRSLEKHETPSGICDECLGFKD